MSKIKELLMVTHEDVRKARLQYNKSESDMKQDVAILKEWLRQQPHLPNDEGMKACNFCICILLFVFNSIT